MRFPKGLVAIVFASLLAACATAPRTVSSDPDLPVEAKQLALPSGAIEYLDTGGTAVPVVLLHSFNVRLWQFQIPEYTKAGYRVIAVDTRDHAAGAPYEIPGSGKALTRLEELVAKLGLTKFHIGGAAGGGVMALQYVMAHPDQIRSVHMTGTLGGLRDPAINALELSLRPAPFNDMPQTFREISGTYRAANPEGTKRWLQLDNEGRAAVTQAPADQPPSRPLPSANALTPEKLKSLQVPIILITGDAENYTPPALNRIFVSHTNNGEGAIIPEAGHNAYWENPEAYNRVVVKFLNKH